METNQLSSNNLLLDLHAEMVQLPKSFRDRVCKECGWSEATFYRKAKGTYPFSNAERDKILAVGDGLLKRIRERSNKYRGR
ncbi:hypothetical protein [Chitinophaga sp. 22620]|jgi:hypothetical protein|uniref:hypothetical protein n=1 Tax=Chitinophaga sp. 22620 TaxID=3453952 RepID=UPI003F8599AB